MDTPVTIKSPVKFIIGAVIALFLLIAFFSSFSVIQPQEKGLQITMGRITAELDPGFYFVFPFIQNVEKYNLTTQKLDSIIAVNANGAITKDNQTIGTSFTVFFRLKSNMIKEVKTQYSLARIEDIIDKTAEQKFKEVIGGNTIFDIAANQNKITAEVNKAIIASVAELPFTIENVQITNYDWSDEFDQNIKATMNQAQQVKQKEQELLVTQQESQKIVKLAEANKEAAVLDAAAKAATGEGIRKYNEEIAKTIDIEKQFRALEIEKIKATRWDGHYVSTNNYGPIPVSMGELKPQ